jgi:hypothetical protein
LLDEKTKNKMMVSNFINIGHQINSLMHEVSPKHFNQKENSGRIVTGSVVAGETDKGKMFGIPNELRVGSMNFNVNGNMMLLEN